MKNYEYRATDRSPYHITSGGLVYRMGTEELEFLVLYRNLPDGRHYHLPKGTLHHDETLEDCARRETLEESGISVEVSHYLGALHSSFIHPKTQLKTDKTAHYFELKYVSSVKEHDGEHDGIEWLSAGKAHNLLSGTEPMKREYEILDRFKKSHLSSDDSYAHFA